MGEWRRIGDLFDFEKGSLQSSKCTPGEYTFITAAEGWKTHREYTHDCEALIFAMGASGSLGRTHYFKGKFISSDLCFILQPKKNLKLDLTFYFYIFNFLRAEIVKKTAKGTSKLAINQENFRNYRLPYFDYDHQLAFRDKLRNVAGITDSFDSEIINQLALLKQLRQAVLQEAVEGKLTADWRKQYPLVKADPQHDAAALLAQIKAEKERLVKAGKIRKEKPLPPIADSDKPFELPARWVWCRFGQVTQSVSTGPFGSMLHKSDYVKNGIPLVNPMNMVSNRIVPSEKMMVSQETSKRLERYILNTGEIVVARRGDLSKCAIVEPENEGWLCGTGSFFLKLCQMDNHFFVKYFVSKYSQSYLLRDSIGQTMDNLNQGLLAKLPFPLPPLAEQQAIVARVDSLMATIDALEAQVTERKEQAQQLMQAVLREAFAGS